MKKWNKILFCSIGLLSIVVSCATSWYSLTSPINVSLIKQAWTNYNKVGFNKENNACQSVNFLSPNPSYTYYPNNMNLAKYFSAGQNNILFSTYLWSSDLNSKPYLLTNSNLELAQNDSSSSPFDNTSSFAYVDCLDCYVGTKISYNDANHTYNISLTTFDTTKGIYKTSDVSGWVTPDIDYICSLSIGQTFTSIDDKWNYVKTLLDKTQIELVHDNVLYIKLSTYIESGNITKGDYFVQLNNDLTINSTPSNFKYSTGSNIRRLQSTVFYQYGKYHLLQFLFTPDYREYAVEYSTKDNITDEWKFIYSKDYLGVQIRESANEKDLLSQPTWLYGNIDESGLIQASAIMNTETIQRIFNFSIDTNAAQYPVEERSLTLNVKEEQVNKSTKINYNVIASSLQGKYAYLYSKNTISNSGQFLGNVIVRIDLDIMHKFFFHYDDNLTLDWEGYNASNSAINIYPCIAPYIDDPGSSFTSIGFVPIPSYDGSRIYVFQNNSTNMWIIDPNLDYKHGMLLDNNLKPIETPPDTKNTKWRNIGTLPINILDSQYINRTANELGGIDFKSLILNKLDYLYINYPPDISKSDLHVDILDTRPNQGEVDIDLTLNKVYFNGEINTLKRIGGKLTITGFAKQNPTPDQYSFNLNNKIEIMDENKSLIFSEIDKELKQKKIIPNSATISIDNTISPNPQYYAKYSATFTIISNKYYDDIGSETYGNKQIVVTAYSTHPSGWKNTQPIDGVVYSVKKESELSEYSTKTLNEVDPYSLNDFVLKHINEIFLFVPPKITEENIQLSFNKKSSSAKDGILTLGVSINICYVDNNIKQVTTESSIKIIDFKLQSPSNLSDIVMNIGKNEKFPSKDSEAFKQLQLDIVNDISSNPKYILPPKTKVNIVLKSQIKDGAVFIASVNQYYDQNGWYVNQYKPFYVTTSGYQVDNNLPSREDATNIRYFRKIDLSIFNWIYKVGFWITIVIVILIPIIATIVTVYGKKRNKY